MKAVILSAGQGRRLLPITERCPKCLLRLGPYRILEWQIRELAAAGIDEIVVVIGFGASMVEDFLDTIRHPGVTIRRLFNPFYRVADNLASCWVARAEMASDFLLVNGDTLFEAGTVRRLECAPSAPVTLAVSSKARYDGDDMKVSLEGRRLKAVGKCLPAAEIAGESLGLTRFRADGARAFAGALEAHLREPRGLSSWYLGVIDALARRGLVETVTVEAAAWAEVDYPKDLAPAERLILRWASEIPGGSARVPAAG